MPPTATFVALNIRSVLTHVGVGMGAASFWRGAWYILDDHLFPDDAAKSAASSLVLGTAGMALSQGLMEKVDVLHKALKLKEQEKQQQQQPQRQRQALDEMIKAKKRRMLPIKVARFGALYTIAVSCVLVWRGTWVGWDVLYEYTHPEQHICQHTAVKRINSTDPGHATASGILSHVLAVTALVGTGVFASVLAPPAATGVIRDFSIQAGSKYQGPAQKLWQQVFSSSTNFKASSKAGGAAAGSATAASFANSRLATSMAPANIVARNYNTTHTSKPVMNRLANTTRIATSIHKY